MNFLAQLWIPIAVSAVLVFVASSLIHMVFKWHNAEYRKFANEDAVRAAIRASNPAPGQYVLPHCTDMKDLKTPEFQQKFVEGPVGFVTLRPSGPPRMGGAMGLWFLHVLVIGAICAYVISKALPPEATFFQVCRVAGALSFLAYAGGSVSSGIWMGKPWTGVAKEVLDAVIYAVITAVTFAWFWAR